MVKNSAWRGTGVVRAAHAGAPLALRLLTAHTYLGRDRVVHRFGDAARRRVGGGEEGD